MRGVSQTELAEAVGLTFQAIQKYESGDNRISASRLHDIALVLDVPVANFFRGLPAGDKAPRAQQRWSHLSSEEAASVLAAFDAIPHRSLRAAFLKTLRQVAGVAQSAAVRHATLESDAAD